MTKISQLGGTTPKAALDGTEKVPSEKGAGDGNEHFTTKTLRSYSQIRRWVSVKDYGAVGDNVTNDGAAFIAAIAALKAQAISDGGSDELIIPQGKYYLGSNALNIKHTLRIVGSGTGQAGGASTALRWDDGVCGFIFNRYNTNGLTGVDTSVSGAADGSTIEGLALVGGYTNPANAESESHAIAARCRISVKNVLITNWAGDGIHIQATAGDTSGPGATEGNANGWRAENARITNCRNGLYIRGADANAGSSRGIDAALCRQSAIYDKSFLGNNHYDAQSEQSGVMSSAALGYYSPWCSYSGKVYAVKADQEAGAATNAPSGTTADNTWWYYLYSGSPSDTFNRPAWVSGLRWRVGGAYLSDCINEPCGFYGCYAEGGQPPSQFAQSVLWLHGPDGAGKKGWPGLGEASFVYARGGLTLSSLGIQARTTARFPNAAVFGEQSLPGGYGPADNLFQFYASNYNTTVWFRSIGTGSDVLDGAITAGLGVGTFYGQNNTRLSVAATGQTMNLSGGAFYPTDDNVQQLGGPSNRMSVLYAGTATVNTSDERLKTLVSIDDKLLDAWGEVEWDAYQWNDAIKLKGEGKARIHHGLIAQKVHRTLKQAGIDGFRFGLLCFDKWARAYEPEMVEADTLTEIQVPDPDRPGELKTEERVVQVMTPALDGKGKPKMKLIRPKGDRWGVRYTEALALEAAYQRRRSDRIEERLAKLEEAKG